MTRAPPEDDPPGKPPPPRHTSQSVTLARMLAGDRPNRESFPDEEPTRPRGIHAEAALLVQYYREMSVGDRECLMRNAERWAERNRK